MLECLSLLEEITTAEALAATAVLCVLAAFVLLVCWWTRWPTDTVWGDLIKAELDKVAEMLEFTPRIPNLGNPPYVLPPRLTWCQYPLFQQAWFETDLRLGIGVLPEEAEEE